MAGVCLFLAVLSGVVAPRGVAGQTSPAHDREPADASVACACSVQNSVTLLGQVACHAALAAAQEVQDRTTPPSNAAEPVDDLADFSFADDGQAEGEKGGAALTGEAVLPEAFVETMSIYGYLANLTMTAAREEGGRWREPSIGDAMLLRLKADFTASSNLKLHAEAAYLAQVGNMNPYVMLAGTGLADATVLGSPQDDFTQTFVIDHVYASANVGPVDLRFGKLPLGWGTGYTFNPTNRVAVPPFLDLVSQETPGTLAIVPNIAVGERFAVTGYVAFQDKTHKRTASSEDAAAINIPYGIKLKAIAGDFDFSLSFFREVIYRELDSATWAPLPPAHRVRRSYYLGGDFVGALWDFGVWGEVVVRMPLDASGTELRTADYELANNLEIVVGADYDIPATEVSTKVEYFYQGTGVEPGSGYSLVDALSGERLVLGRHYLVVFAKRAFLDNALELTAAAVVNLGDGSVAVLPSLAWRGLDNLEISGGLFVLAGPPGSEFDGRYQTPLGEIDLTDNLLVYLRLKMSF